MLTDDLVRVKEAVANKLNLSGANIVLQQPIAAGNTKLGSTIAVSGASLRALIDALSGANIIKPDFRYV